MPLLKDGALTLVLFLLVLADYLRLSLFLRCYSFVKMSVSRERIKKTNEKLWSFGIRVALKRFSDVSFLIEKNNELFFPLPLGEVEKKILVNVEEVGSRARQFNITKIPG